ncbi:hypothetical protein GCM10010272_55000 [Streptomyces lateritius]|nr:hypothetical protein GCM10010272_55000 [Streptomyces lateritius]
MGGDEAAGPALSVAGQGVRGVALVPVGVGAQGEAVAARVHPAGGVGQESPQARPGVGGAQRSGAPQGEESHRKGP